MKRPHITPVNFWNELSRVEGIIPLFCIVKQLNGRYPEVCICIGGVGFWLDWR